MVSNQPTTQSIDFSHIGIGNVLRTERLAVPLNQREYAWLKEHVLALFHDLSKAINNNKPEYFLGTIVLTRGKNGVPRVTDGQQRLATVTILLGAIRDYFSERGDTMMVTSIENDFLKTIVRDTKSYQPKLTLNVQDNAFFAARILSSPNDKAAREIEPTADSHRNIAEAATLAAKHVQDIVSQHGTKGDARTQALNAWINYVQARARVIVLKVPDERNAFAMFETLNDRGLRTTQADLVKNYLFGLAEERIQEAHQKWAVMKGALEALEIEDTTMVYLRHFLIHLKGHTIVKEIFEKILDSVQTKDAAIAFFDSLASAAQDYVAIQTGEHPKWNKYNDSVRHSIATLLQLRITPIRPLMLSVARNFDEAETAKAFRVFVSWSVRFLITGGARSGSVEEAFANAAFAITEGKVKNTKELIATMLPTLKTDAEFEAAFAATPVSLTYLARYYLRAMERHLKQDPEPEWVPNEEKVINLEHVLPQNPDNKWPAIPPELHKALYKRLGNLVLLPASINELAGNESFADKKALYAKSGYLITQRIAKATAWGKDEIDEQQKYLATLAVRTWPLQ